MYIPSSPMIQTISDLRDKYDLHMRVERFALMLNMTQLKTVDLSDKFYEI